jgi:hypothetical protein
MHHFNQAGSVVQFPLKFYLLVISGYASGGMVSRKQYLEHTRHHSGVYNVRKDLRICMVGPLTSLCARHTPRSHYQYFVRGEACPLPGYLCDCLECETTLLLTAILKG